MTALVKKIQGRFSNAMLSLWGILITLFIITGLVDHYFFTISSIGVTLQLAVPLGLLAAGQTICMLTGGIDLSIAMIATGAAFIVSIKSPSGLGLAILYATIYCILIGTINGLAVGLFGMNPLIMTLGMNAVLIGVFTVGITTFLKGSSTMPDIIIKLSTATIVDPISWPLILWLVFGGIFLFLLYKTGLGRLIYAVGDNAKAARLAGVRVWKVQLAAYIICALFGGLAGLMIGGQSGAVARVLRVQGRGQDGLEFHRGGAAL
jgi:ribose transport system permease protein